MKPIWPKIFVDEDDYIQSKAEACVLGLEGWALCMAGNRPTENFGKGMNKISVLLKEELNNKSAAPENLMSISDLFITNN